MTQYNRVMAGAKSVHAAECVQEGFIGVDYEINEDLSDKLPDNWREFNARRIQLRIATRFLRASAKTS